jgi:hypothetical protein
VRGAGDGVSAHLPQARRGASWEEAVEAEEVYKLLQVRKPPPS